MKFWLYFDPPFLSMQRPLPVESRSLENFEVEIYGSFVYIKIELCGSHRIAVLW